MDEIIIERYTRLYFKSEARLTERAGVDIIMPPFQVLNK